MLMVLGYAGMGFSFFFWGGIRGRVLTFLVPPAVWVGVLLVGFALKIDTQMCFNGRFLPRVRFRIVLRPVRPARRNLCRFVMPSVVFLCDWIYLVIPLLLLATFSAHSLYFLSLCCCCIYLCACLPAIRQKFPGQRFFRAFNWILESRVSSLFYCHWVANGFDLINECSN